MALLMPPTAEGALDQAGQLIRGAVDGLVQGISLVCDGDGLAPFQAGFHHAALVVLALLIAVLVAQVYLHPRDAIADSGESALDYVTDLSSKRLMTFDLMVRVDLYLHVFL